MSGDSRPAREPFTNLDTITLIFLIGAFLGIVLPGLSTFGQRLRGHRQATQCRDNLAQMAKAVEHYYRGRHKEYPAGLKDLIPRYLEEMPRCPAREPDERESGDGKIDYTYQLDEAVPNYTLYCKGQHHEDAGLRVNEPSYSLVKKFSKQTQGLGR